LVADIDFSFGKKRITWNGDGIDEKRRTTPFLVREKVSAGLDGKGIELELANHHLITKKPEIFDWVLYI
jgi:hypothetical protein